MDMQELCTMCRELPHITVDYPFGPEYECYRIGGRIFASVSPNGIPGALTILFEDESIPREAVRPMVILRCEPATGDFWRRQYPGLVLRPYHSPPSQQPYANTVLLDDAIPDEVLRDMVHHAYTRIKGKLPKKIRDTLC